MSEHDGGIRPIETPAMIQELADGVGGTITECAALPDGSGFAIMSMPLRKDHWIYQKDAKGWSMPPPMPFRVGTSDAPLTLTLTRQQFAAEIRRAGKYAVRSATMGGTEMDFDPDALLQNLVVGFLGYWTPNGLSEDAWANPTGLEDVQTTEADDALSSNALPSPPTETP